MNILVSKYNAEHNNFNPLRLFANKGDFNRFALFELLKENKHLSNKNKTIEKTNLFFLLEEYGYDFVVNLINSGKLSVDKALLWSDEKAKEIELFKFIDEDKWYLLKDLYPSNVFFNKFEKFLNGFNLKVTLLNN